MKAKCPKIQIKLENLKVKALVDSGSEITGISEEFFRRNINTFSGCPILPVSGKIIKGATGEKSCRLRQQILVNTKIGKTETSLIFLVVPKLVRDCIIGYDAQKGLRKSLDTNLEKITFELNNQIKTIPYVDISLIKDPYDCLKIVVVDDKIKINNDDLVSANTQAVGSICHLDTSIHMGEVKDKVENCDDLSEPQREKLIQLIWKYRGIFRKSPGRLSCYKHKLEMTDTKPFYTKPYPIPINQREKVQKEINKMLELGIIRRSKSPYINPVVVVKKKDGSVRLCLDARKLNQQLLDDRESPPGIEEVLPFKDEVSFMSCFDLTSSFWQIPLEEESKKYTAFIIDNVVYEFNVVPFGTSTSTAALLRGLSFVLQNLRAFIKLFVDDLLCLSKTFEEHLRHLELLFKNLQKHDLTLNFKKANFIKKEVRFLGYILQKDGLKPQPEKVEIIQNFKAPKNVKQLQSFLGFVNFYTKFTKNYAHATLPLVELLKKNTPFIWTEERQRAFQNVKDLFINCIMLKFADPKKPYILTTDASEYALGGILSQINNEGDEEVISFISRTLKGPELNYFTTEKEMLALVWSLSKLEFHLKGANIITRTDHKALTFLRTCKFGNERLRRWNLAIQDFKILPEYLPGEKNVCADFLSRHIYGIEQKTKETEIIISTLLQKRVSKELEEILKNMAKLQKNDPKINSKIENFMKADSLTLRNFKYEDGILSKKNPNGTYKILLSERVLNKIIEELHVTYGHIGTYKLYKMLQQEFIAKKLRKTCSKAIASCDICQKSKYSTQATSSHMQSIITQAPHEILSIDFYGPLPTSVGGTKHILVTIDAFSKFVALYPVKKATSNIVIRKIFDHYIPTYGKPEKILCDHGTQFTSATWKKKLKEAGIQLMFSSVRHPQSNIVERVNRELGRFFRTFLTDKHTGWFEFVPIIQCIINETHHITTEITPLELHMGKPPTKIWRKWLKTSDSQANQDAQILLAKSRIKNKREKEAKKRSKYKTRLPFSTGNLVLLKANNLSDMFENRISKFLKLYEGPYRIKKKVHEDTYILIDENTNKERGMFHGNDLKLYTIPQTKA